MCYAIWALPFKAGNPKVQWVRTKEGRPVDLTGWSAKAQIRRGVADENPEIIYEILTAIPPAQNGTPPSSVTISVPAVESTRICAMEGPFVWDLQLISPDGITDTVIKKSPVTTEQEVTR